MVDENRPPRTLEEFADEQAQARFVENQEVRRQLNAVRATYGVVKAENVRLRADLMALQKIQDEALVLQPQPGWLRPRRKKGESKRATLVVNLSDVHGGERVEANEMQGYNAYNLDICDYRLRRFFEKTVMLARDYVSGVSFDGIVLSLGGDMVSGDIHDELQQTNELSTFETVLWLAPRIVAGLELWATEFGNVHVVSAPGNHGRDSRIPRYKKRSAYNADTMLAKMVAYYFGATNSSAGSVTFDIPDAFDVDFSVYGFKFSLEHGDNMRFSGTSEIGALGPVKRGTLRKSRQHQEEGRSMDYNLVGHFHQYVPAASQGFVMNGSVVGYNEYARGWHLTPEPPQQALMVVTPEYGITQNVSVLVSKRSEEGW